LEDRLKNTPKESTQHISPIPKTFVDILSQRNASNKVQEYKNKDILILAGADDLLVPPRLSKKVLEELNPKTSKYIEFPGVGHAVPLEMQKEFTLWTLDRL
jgi:pimeloyl-ACP methyl ester carboxylesterase